MDIPQVGVEYNSFDDGKVGWSRLSTVVVEEVVPFASIDSETLKLWQSENHGTCYDNTTDYFIKTWCGEIEKELIYVRSKFGWFSLGYWAGRLDIDGSLYKLLK